MSYRPVICPDCHTVSTMPELSKYCSRCGKPMVPQERRYKDRRALLAAGTQETELREAAQEH